MGKRRTAARRKGQASPAARQVTIGPFALAFGGVLVVGGLALALGMWLTTRGPAAPAATSAPTAAIARISTEIGAHFTAEGDPALGEPDAPLTVIEYSDYLCPNCQQFATEVVPYLRRSWLANGMVRLIYKDFAIRGPQSELAAQAAHCAGDQGRYWGYHDLLYDKFGMDDLYEPASLVALAVDIGIDAGRFEACLASGVHMERVRDTTAEAHALGFEGTPTYMIDGRQTAGFIPVPDWEALFQAYAQELSFVP